MIALAIIGFCLFVWIGWISFWGAVRRGPIIEKNQAEEIMDAANERVEYVAPKALVNPVMPESDLIDDQWWSDYVTEVIDRHTEVLKESGKDIDYLNPPKPKTVNVATIPDSHTTYAATVRVWVRSGLSGSYPIVGPKKGFHHNAEILASLYADYPHLSDHHVAVKIHNAPFKTVNQAWNCTYQEAMDAFDLIDCDRLSMRWSWKNANVISLMVVKG